MAIGSDAEIGVTFGKLGDMSSDDISAWFAHMRTHWQPELMNGYSTVKYPERRVPMPRTIRRVTEAGQARPGNADDINLAAPVEQEVEDDDGESDLGE